jgi:hypothetical protein
MNVLVVDVGGTHIKVLATGQKESSAALASGRPQGTNENACRRTM